jgi:hypothetical protein
VVRKYQVEAVAGLCSLLIVCICFFADRADSQSAPVKAAVFNFELVDTSHEGELRGVRSDESARLDTLGEILRTRLADDGRYTLVDLAPLGQKVAHATPLRKCNGCAAELAKEAGADVAVTAWVQKVSNLILNVNVEIVEAGTGKLLQVESADIRGNTDESWKRGLDYILRNRILKPAGGG